MIFRHSTSIQLRFADMDAMNHVNNANYLTYLELARISYFNDVLRTEMNHSPGFILAKAVIDFIQPIGMGDEIKILTRCSRLGNKSFDLDYEIVRSNPLPGVVAKASTVLVGYDYHLKKTVSIPDEWRKKIEDFEGVKLS